MMNAASNQTDFALDLHGLNRLRSLSQKDKGAALKQTAQQFEALFIQMMLKQGRQSGFEDPLFGSNQMEFYQDMFDQQLALTMAKTGQMGMGDLVVRQMQAKMGLKPEAQAAAEKPAEAARPFRRFLGSPKPIHIPRAVAEAEANAVSQVAASDKRGEEMEKAFDSPQSFIQTLMPYAEKAAQKLGVSPRVLLAQAALETGWGKYMSRDSEGQASFNLFNIKAGQAWQGKSLEMNTLEYIGGQFMSENASFRAYDGFGESFDDYVDFLKSNPRYGDAIAQAKGDIDFAHALQGAGYATDPDYASKITRVLHSTAMAEAFGKLKVSQSTPLNNRGG